MKKSILFSAILLSGFTCLNAQTNLTFQNLANMHVARAAISTACDSNNIYVSGGFSSATAYLNLMEKYDIATNNWSQFTNLLIPKRYASSVISGNSIYIFNGSVSGGFNARLEIVDLTTGAITLSTNNPYPVKSSGAAYWNGNIYVFGGSTTSAFSNKLYSYNIASQQWTALADMPEAKETSGEIINGKLYVIGGYKGATISNRIDVYDIQTDTWSSLITMQNAISGHSTAAYGHKIYTMFDYTYQTYLGYYDILTNTYTTLQETNLRGRRNAGARIVGNKLYVMGGDTASVAGSNLANVQVANLTATYTAIQELEDSPVKVYPNPTSNILFIDGYEPGSEVTIIDQEGNTILDEKLISNSINVSNLSSNLYILKLSSGSHVFTTTFIKE